ncbi:ABC transporter permease [Ectobacillus sp. JY-23]|uniref:ABC transporter permease n=1 Tax=Ectobacillus sp. JY-23 TaxID=2933872 RepID=UPI001FF2728C|nr:ABC transporter permease [Ectobacillus sp. JY-23]UOY91540.1 ABC transporter permease [Ectobacillus sp. JY-23]
MGKVWAICLFELQRLLGNPRSYLVMLLMPLAFTFVFGTLLSGSSMNKTQLLFVEEESSMLSKTYYQELKGNSLFDVSVVSAKEAKKQLADKKVAGVIVIPKEFTESFNVSLQYSPEFTSRGSVKQELEQALTKVKTKVEASKVWSSYSEEPWEGMYQKLSGTVQPTPLRKEFIMKTAENVSMSNASARSAGFSIMFVMIIMMTATGAILEARKNGVWYRMMTMPASRMQVLGGYVLSFFLLGWIQFGALMLFTNVLFDVHWGDMLGILLLVSALLLAIIGMALFIAGIVKTSEQQSAIGNMVVISSCMIAGVYWPIEIEPMFMQRMADFVPQTWAMRGFTELIARGGGIADIAVYVAVLFIFAIVFFTVGLKRIRYE